MNRKSRHSSNIGYTRHTKKASKTGKHSTAYKAKMRNHTTEGHVPLAEQTLTTVPEHLSSPTIVSGVPVSDLEFYVFCRSLFVIVLSVLRRYMYSDLPFGIFQLFYFRKKYRSYNLDDKL
jgi:hypothetical protein